jgi:YspA, cpYpsA-related SLOG family
MKIKLDGSNVKKVIFFGGRNYNNYDSFKNHVLEFYPDLQIEIVCGMAPGADLLGKRFAEEYNLKLYKFPADWDRYGRRAGYIRNKEMGNFADEGLGFWDKKSPGTKMMINILCELKKITHIIYY